MQYRRLTRIKLVHIDLPYNLIVGNKFTLYNHLVIYRTKGNCNKLIGFAKLERFENGFGIPLSVDVCDAIPPSWYENCRSAPATFSLSPDAYSGAHSLACAVNLSPEKSLAYSVNFPLNPPVFADEISAKVYITDPAWFDKIWLLGKEKESDRWVLSELRPAKKGWQHLTLNLRQLPDEAVSPVNEAGIDELDLDFFMKRGVQPSEQIIVLIDDIELVIPAAK